MCQHDTFYESFWVLGKTSNVTWDVKSNKSFTVTYRGGDVTADTHKER